MTAPVETVQLQWTAATDEWAAFREAAAEDFGVPGREGPAIERAWQEYRADHDLEAAAETIADAVGLPEAETDAADSHDASVRTVPPLADKETEWVRVRIAADVKDEMAAYAAECDVPKNAVLRAVLSWYAGGGLVGHVAETVGPVADALESGRAEVTLTDADSEENDELGPVERRTRKIARRLPATYSADDVAEATRAEGWTSPPSIKQYTETVAEYKGVRRWETADDAPDMFFPPETWETRKTGEILDALGGDSLTDTGPTDTEGDPVGFSSQQLADAIGGCGIDVTDANRETVTEYRERVLARIGYVQGDERGTFVPADESTTTTTAAVEDAEGSQDDGGGVEPGAVSIDEVDEEAGALMDATPVRADGGRPAGQGETEGGGETEGDSP